MEVKHPRSSGERGEGELVETSGRDLVGGTDAEGHSFIKGHLQGLGARNFESQGARQEA